jgi:hypothetical protein
MRYDIRQNEGGEHQDVNVSHEARCVAKNEVQGGAIEEKYKGYCVRANRPNAVLGDLAIARGKKCGKCADKPKNRERIPEIAEAWRLRRTHEKSHERRHADGPGVNAAEHSVDARAALTEASGELEWTNENGRKGSQNVRDQHVANGKEEGTSTMR